MSFPDLLGAQGRHSSLGTSGNHSRMETLLPCNAPVARWHHQRVQRLGTGLSESSCWHRCPRPGELRARAGMPSGPSAAPSCCGHRELPGESTSL